MLTVGYPRSTIVFKELHSVINFPICFYFTPNQKAPVSSGDEWVSGLGFRPGIPKKQVSRVYAGGSIMKEDAIKQYKRRLLQLLKRKALKRGKIILSSGKVSSYYLDGRLITLTSSGAYWLGSIILDLIKGKRVTAIGGPTLGADPIVGAVITLAAIKKKKLSGFIVRKETKKYGMQRLIEGPSLPRGSRVVMVDDVATTGASLITAKKVLQKEGIIVDCVVVIVDREEGARENLAKVDCPLIPLFKKRDIIGGETSNNKI